MRQFKENLEGGYIKILSDPTNMQGGCYGP